MVTLLWFRGNSRRRQKCHCTLNCTRSLSIWPPRGLFGRLRPFFLGGLFGRLRPFFLGGLLQAVEIGFHPDGSQLQVARGDDVVTAVDGLRGVTADPHRDIARDTGPLHIADCATAKVMEVQALQTSILAAARPALQVAAEGPAQVVED